MVDGRRLELPASALRTPPGSVGPFRTSGGLSPGPGAGRESADQLDGLPRGTGRRLRVDIEHHVRGFPVADRLHGFQVDAPLQHPCRAGPPGRPVERDPARRPAVRNADRRTGALQEMADRVAPIALRLRHAAPVEVVRPAVRDGVERAPEAGGDRHGVRFALRRIFRIADDEHSAVIVLAPEIEDVAEPSERIEPHEHDRAIVFLQDLQEPALFRGREQPALRPHDR